MLVILFQSGTGVSKGEELIEKLEGLGYSWLGNDDAFYDAFSNGRDVKAVVLGIPPSANKMDRTIITRGGERKEEDIITWVSREKDDVALLEEMLKTSSKFITVIELGDFLDENFGKAEIDEIRKLDEDAFEHKKGTEYDLKKLKKAIKRNGVIKEVLEKHDALDKFINNYLNLPSPTNLPFDSYDKRLEFMTDDGGEEFISWAFSYQDSPEGTDFWVSIDKEYTEKLSEKAM